MKNIFLLSLLVFLMISCSANRYRSEVDFANKLAQQGLWEEAYYRWAKSLDKHKPSAVVYNNLAVYFEKKGERKKAEEAYRQALELDPENKFIQSNFKKFKQKNEMRTEEKKKNEK